MPRTNLVLSMGWLYSKMVKNGVRELKKFFGKSGSVENGIFIKKGLQKWKTGKTKSLLQHVHTVYNININKGADKNDKCD